MRNYVELEENVMGSGTSLWFQGWGREGDHSCYSVHMEVTVQSSLSRLAEGGLNVGKFPGDSSDSAHLTIECCSAFAWTLRLQAQVLTLAKCLVP